MLVDRGAEPVRADVLLRERGERRYVLDADDGTGTGAGAAAAATATAADEVVAYACEVARAGADVEHARAAAAGTVVQIREEELGCVRVLLWCGVCVYMEVVA